MITLINTNSMKPAIGPIGLDYIAAAVRKAGIECDILDLSFCDKPQKALADYFENNQPVLAGMTFRNVDDCFWPSGQWFVPQLKQHIEQVRKVSEAKVVLGGVGFSIMPQRIVEYTHADFGICGDGEDAIVLLYNEIISNQTYESVSGLVWRTDGKIISNEPNWPDNLSLPTERDAVDNKKYFEQGGQCGIETKRGCNRPCIYCADSLAKGKKLRVRQPAEVADEVESLLRQGIDVFHICDSEFNVPISHARAVCREFVKRELGEKIKWYTYMTVTPFDDELAYLMKKAGCVGVDFTGDSASGLMLGTYRQQHRKEDLAKAAKLCRKNNITVMFDLLLGGPGETEETLAETIGFMKKISPDAVGAGLGVRIYPQTEMAKIVHQEGNLETNPNIKRKYDGQVDFFKPTFYISNLLGEKPAQLVRDLIAGDKRFFEPMLEVDEGQGRDHNYNDNTELCQAIAAGARGAYWDILRQ